MLVALLRKMTMIMAEVHDLLMHLNDGFELSLSDKEWHFIIMALLAMCLFLVVHAVFTRLAKWSITAISFIYVFTVMTVLGFAIEIGQAVSGTGAMEFLDITAGLAGVLAFFAAYTAYRLLLYVGKWVIQKVSGEVRKDSHK